MIPLALWGATVSLASHQIDPVSAAEGLLLAGLGAAVLLCVAALERSGSPVGASLPMAASGSVVGPGACLAVLILWAVPSGAARGSGLTALLLFLLLKAAAARLAEASNRLPLVLTAPLCLGLQCLYRPDLFLHRQPSREALFGFWGPALSLALAAALALNLLARRHGARNALIAGGVVLVLSGGWTLVGAGGLLALAAGELAMTPGNPERSVRGWGYWTPAALLLLGLAAAALLGAPRRSLLYLLLLAGVGAVTTRWAQTREPGSSRPAGVGGSPRLPAWLPLLGALGLGALALLLEDSAAVPARGAGEALHLLVLGLALLPQALLALRRRTLPAILLAALAVRWLPGAGLEGTALGGTVLGGAALGAALAFLALELPQRRRGATAQNLWLGFWLLLATVASGYPWLRRGSLESFLGALPDAFGWGGWILWLAGALLVVGTWLIEDGLGGRGGFHPEPRFKFLLPVAAGFALLAGSLAILSPAAGQPPLVPEAVILTKEHPRWHVDIPPRAVSRLVLVSNLAFATDLPPDQPVAVLRLHHPDGGTSVGHLRAGIDTAEWAARRPDVARHMDLVAPPAWQVAAAPDGPYFAQRYRSVHLLDTDEPVISIDIFRRRNLPPEVSLTLFRVDVLP